MEDYSYRLTGRGRGESPPMSHEESLRIKREFRDYVPPEKEFYPLEEYVKVKYDLTPPPNKECRVTEVGKNQFNVYCGNKFCGQLPTDWSFLCSDDLASPLEPLAYKFFVGAKSLLEVFISLHGGLKNSPDE